MRDVKDKSPLHHFMEQLAIPLTTAFMSMLCAWIVWVSIVVLFTAEDKTKIKVLESKISTNILKVSIHDSKIYNLNKNMEKLASQIEREFNQTREMITMAIRTGK